MAEFGGLQSSSDESEEDLAEEVIRKGVAFGISSVGVGMHVVCFDWSHISHDHVELSEVPLGELQDLRQKVGAKK